MTYNVFGGTLNLAQSQSPVQLRNPDITYTDSSDDS